jgi:hypothetical protein
MKLFPSISLLALAIAPAFASATITLVDFEKSWSYGDTVDATYAANGVTFTNVLGVSNEPPFDPYFSNAPSPLGVAMIQLDGVVNTAAYMNVAQGVTIGLSFYYSTPNDVAGAVKAYAGLNGTGALLGTLDLSRTSDVYDTWKQVNFNFSGTALSFDLTGSANMVGLDNIAAVPEPEGYALALAGLSVLGLLARRRPQR